MVRLLVFSAPKGERGGRYFVFGLLLLFGTARELSSGGSKIDVECKEGGIRGRLLG